MQVVLVVTCFVLDVINLFWFYKIYQGAYRLLVMFVSPPVDTKGGAVGIGGAGVMEKKEKKEQGGVTVVRGGPGVTGQGHGVMSQGILSQRVIGQGQGVEGHTQEVTSQGILGHTQGVVSQGERVIEQGQGGAVVTSRQNLLGGLNSEALVRNNSHPHSVYSSGDVKKEE